MPHFPGHEGSAQLAPEFQGPSLLRNIQAGLEPRRQQSELRLGQLARTRQLSPAQESFLLAQGQQQQSTDLINAQLRGDVLRAGQEAQDRRIGEARQFQTFEEQRQFERNAALREQEQKQSLLRSIFGDIAGLGGTALGGLLSRPRGGG